MDRLTYHRIAQESFPEANIIPTGSVGNILALNQLSEELRTSIFGVDLFMIRDRDGLTDHQLVSFADNARIRCLGRRHVENYYLDAHVLARVAQSRYLDKQFHDPAHVEEILQKIAEAVGKQAVLLAMKEHIRLNGTLDAPRLRGIDRLTPEEIGAAFRETVRASLAMLVDDFSDASLAARYEEESRRHDDALASGT